MSITCCTAGAAWADGVDEDAAAVLKDAATVIDEAALEDADLDGPASLPDDEHAASPTTAQRTTDAATAARRQSQGGRDKPRTLVTARKGDGRTLGRRPSGQDHPAGMTTPAAGWVILDRQPETRTRGRPHGR
jgi:hypothetical protein